MNLKTSRTPNTAFTSVDVERQIKHMMAFIEQEANEKAEEIDAKAEEEFNIEKGRLVQQQRLNIMEYYDKREKQVVMKKKVQCSSLVKEARLKVLKIREEYVMKVLSETRKKLVEITKNKQSYDILLEALILQGLLRLLEPIVILKIRSQDKNTINSILPKIVTEYQNVTESKVEVLIDNDTFLPENSIGGVELYNRMNRIKIKNTLEIRLKLISLKSIPFIRMILFGENPNRIYVDVY